MSVIWDVDIKMKLRSGFSVVLQNAMSLYDLFCYLPMASDTALGPRCCEAQHHT